MFDENGDCRVRIGVFDSLGDGSGPLPGLVLMDEDGEPTFSVQTFHGGILASVEILGERVWELELDASMLGSAWNTVLETRRQRKAAK
jgi:hypothetical protein